MTTDPRFGRRLALKLAAGLAAGAAAAATLDCTRASETEEGAATMLEPAAPTVAPIATALQLVDWTFPEASFGTAAASILVSPHAPGARFPVLVALHGRGEARKDPARGARGWPDDYALVRAMKRVAAPPLTREDYLGFVRAPELARTNAALAARPFGGLVVVCPYVPDVHLEDGAAIDAYGQWILSSLLPRVRRELPVLLTPAATGIDGISLGGAVALRVGLTHPEAFGAVGALQPALEVTDTQSWTDLVVAARRVRPQLALRLTTSEGDPFRGAVGKLSSALQAAQQSHDSAILPGPHDYPFNRGPGALTMLLWHDRVLRG